MWLSGKYIVWQCVVCGVCHIATFVAAKDDRYEYKVVFIVYTIIWQLSFEPTWWMNSSPFISLKSFPSSFSFFQFFPLYNWVCCVQFNTFYFILYLLFPYKRITIICICCLVLMLQHFKWKNHFSFHWLQRQNKIKKKKKWIKCLLETRDKK